MENIITSEFNGTPVSIIDRDGQKWLTAEQIGRCLGYDPANARKGVLKIYERHGDEFGTADTFVVKLTTNPQGGNPTARIFSATGCIKLGFFANTPRAKDFRAWASTVLAGQAGALVPAPDDGRLQLASELGALRDELRLQHGLILGLYGKLERAQRGQINALSALERVRRQQVVRDAIQTVIRMEAQGVPRPQIAQGTGKTMGHIRKIVFDARRDGLLPAGSDAAQRELSLV